MSPVSINVPPPPPVPRPQGKWARVARILTGGFLAAVSILCYGGAAVMLSETFVAWWVPTLIACGVAGAATPLAGKVWGWVTGKRQWWVRRACSMAAGTGIFLCGLLLVNMLGADTQSRGYVDATVSQKVRKTKHHTKRVGRRTYTTGREYYVFEATLRLPDGRAATVNVPLDVYNRLQKGQTVGVKVANGALGWDVIDTHDLRYPPKARKRHAPCTSGNPAASRVE